MRRIAILPRIPLTSHREAIGMTKLSKGKATCHPTTLSRKRVQEIVEEYFA